MTATPVIHAFWWLNADPSPYVEYASMARGAMPFNADTLFNDVEVFRVHRK